MITTNNKIKCDSCGRFISIKNIENGKASHELRTPDSYYSCENYESYCENCKNSRDMMIEELQKIYRGEYSENFDEKEDEEYKFRMRIGDIELELE